MTNEPLHVPAPETTADGVEASAASKFWNRSMDLLGEVDRRFRRSLPSDDPAPLSLARVWREAGVLRYLLVFQFLMFWSRISLVPLIARDYDLFFHLAHGRYQETLGRVPTDAFFSFLDPRPYLDYYWLFQRLVYELWSSFGYTGLFVLRGVVATATLALLALFLYGRCRSATGFLGGLLVFTLVGSRLADVLVAVRPFVFSYLFLLAMLFILERHSRSLPLLPVLGVAWMNLHGVEHPMMLAVVLAYLGDEFLVYCRRREFLPASRRRVRWLVLTLPTVLVSPHFFDLVAFPFRSNALSSLYVGEMQRPTLGSLLTLSVGPEAPKSLYGIAVMLFLLAVASVVRLLLGQNLRPAHLVLMLAGTFLALQGYRFTAEFALLLLPLLAQGAFFAFRRPWPPLATLVVTGLVGLLTYNVANDWTTESRAAYPLSFNSFPYLTAKFLKDEAEPGGRVYNSATLGGFYMWEVGDRHQIMMDLEVMAIFRDDDFFLNRVVLLDADLFRAFVERYHPDYLAVRFDLALVSPFLRHSEDFVPVAFDDGAVLLVDRRRHPELAEKWRLRALDPFRAKVEADYRLSPEAAAEGRRLYALEPRGLRLPVLLAQEAMGRGDLVAAERYIDTLLEVAPENADTWTLLAQLALRHDDLPAAVAALEKSLVRSSEEARGGQHLLLGRILHRLGDSKRALKHLRARGNFFDPMPIEDMALLVELLEVMGPQEEAAAARRLLELRRGQAKP